MGTKLLPTGKQQTWHQLPAGRCIFQEEKVTAGNTMLWKNKESLTQ